MPKCSRHFFSFSHQFQIFCALLLPIWNNLCWELLITVQMFSLLSPGKMSRDRALRKQQQLNNLVAAVKKLAKPGDVIVDFCSGGVRYIFLTCCNFFWFSSLQQRPCTTAKWKYLCWNFNCFWTYCQWWGDTQHEMTHQCWKVAQRFYCLFFVFTGSCWNCSCSHDAIMSGKF